MAEIQAGTAESATPRQADTFSPVPPEWILDCQFVEENAAGLALGVLQPEDAFRISQHLSWCPSCARLIHETRRTVSYLPFTSPQAAPSASAKSNLFDRIKADRLTGSVQLSNTSITTLTIPATGFEIPVTSNAVSGTGLAGSGHPGSSSKRRFKWQIIAAPLAAVPLIVALAIVGGWALRTQGELNDQRAEARELETNYLAAVDQASIWSGGEQAKWTLVPTENELGSSAGGRLLTTAASDRFQGNLKVWNLPSSVEVYEVIFETKDRQSFIAGEFTVDANGNAENVRFSVSEPLNTYRAVHIRPATDDGTSAKSDSVTTPDVLWTDMLGNLGGSGGTEANARAK